MIHALLGMTESRYKKQRADLEARLAIERSMIAKLPAEIDLLRYEFDDQHAHGHENAIRNVAVRKAELKQRLERIEDLEGALRGLEVLRAADGIEHQQRRFLIGEEGQGGWYFQAAQAFEGARYRFNGRFADDIPKKELVAYIEAHGGLTRLAAALERLGLRDYIGAKFPNSAWSTGVTRAEDFVSDPNLKAALRKLGPARGPWPWSSVCDAVLGPGGKPAGVAR